MFKKLTLLAALLVIYPVFVFGQDKGLKRTSYSRTIFENNDCEKTSSCDLKKVEFTVEDYQQRFFEEEHQRPGYYYGTRLVAKYQTESLARLESYVFVQFIKGCAFQSSVNNGIVVNHYLSTLRYDGTTEFKFTDWTIDSYDTDPAYSSIPESRHAAYSKLPGSVELQTEKFYGDGKPLTPELYVKDRIVPATEYPGGTAQNVSLKFKMCIYKASDVPSSIPQDLNFAKPIYCHDWSSSYVYNHETAKFENPREIVPACH